MSRAAHASRRAAKYPGGGTITPPALSTGSTITAAGRAVKFASASVKLVFRHKKSHPGKVEADGQRAGDERSRAVQPLVQPEHVVAAGGIAGQIHRGLDGVAAAHQEERLLKWRGEKA